MKEKLQTQIKNLASDNDQNHHGKCLAFVADIVNSPDQRNEFIMNLALTSDEDLIDLVKENSEAFPYLLLLQASEKENYKSLSTLMGDYVKELQIYLENVEQYVDNEENLNSEWKDYYSEEIKNYKQWIEYFQQTTVTSLIYNKFIALEIALKTEEGLTETDENLLDSLYKKTLETEAALVQDFNQIAATQLAQSDIETTLNLLKEVNKICIKHYNTNRPYSNELVLARNNGLDTIDKAKVQQLIEIKKAEENKKLQEEKELKIANAISTLKAISKDLDSGKNLKDLITKADQIFAQDIENDNFKKLKTHLKEIAETENLGAFKKFLDASIQFFKYLVGKDRVSETRKVIKKFSDSITQEKTKLENIQGYSRAA